MFAMKCFHHRLLVDPKERTIRHCSRGSHALSLTGQRAFPKEVSVTQHAYGGFSAGLGYDGELHPAGLDIKDRVRPIPLGKDSSFLGNSHVLPASANGCEESGGIELALLLIRYCGRTHQR